MQNAEYNGTNLQIEKVQIKSPYRNSSFELLRIFAMILIIMHHFCLHGVLKSGKEVSDNNFILHCSYYFGTLGNYLFMLISGYFLLYSKFSYKKIIKICVQMTFYSVPTAIILYCFGLLPAKEVYFSFIPYLRDLNWYACAYIVFYFFVPYLNKLILSLDSKELFSLTVICIAFNCVIPKMPYIEMFKPDLILQFFMMYFAANYIKSYTPEIAKDKRKLIILIIICITIIESIYFLNDSENLSQYFLYKVIRKFFFIKHFILFILSVSIFSLFQNFNFKNSLVNFLVSGTFGIYLLHDNNYIRPVLWNNILKTEMFSDSKYLFLYMFFCVFMIFITGTIIDAFRRILFDLDFFQRKK